MCVRASFGPILLMVFTFVVELYKNLRIAGFFTYWCPSPNRGWDWVTAVLAERVAALSSQAK